MGMRVGGGDTLGTLDNEKLKLFPTKFRVSEDIFGREGSFYASFVLAGATLTSILEDSQLWSPIGSTSFAKWRKSMETSAHHPRGHARLSDEKDIIIDLCTQQPPEAVGETKLRPARPGRILAAGGGKK